MVKVRKNKKGLVIWLGSYKCVSSSLDLIKVSGQGDFNGRTAELKAGVFLSLRKASTEGKPPFLTEP